MHHLQYIHSTGITVYLYLYAIIFFFKAEVGAVDRANTEMMSCWVTKNHLSKISMIVLNSCVLGLFSFETATQLLWGWWYAKFKCGLGL